MLGGTHRERMGQVLVEAQSLPPGFSRMESAEAIEPRPEPDPSARDEFHQAYTRKLQAADKDVEDYSRTLDSISYPVGDRI